MSNYKQQIIDKLNVPFHLTEFKEDYKSYMLYLDDKLTSTLRTLPKNTATDSDRLIKALIPKAYHNRYNNICKIVDMFTNSGYTFQVKIYMYHNSKSLHICKVGDEFLKQANSDEWFDIEILFMPTSEKDLTLLNTFHNEGIENLDFIECVIEDDEDGKFFQEDEDADEETNLKLYDEYIKQHKRFLGFYLVSGTKGYRNAYYTIKHLRKYL